MFRLDVDESIQCNSSKRKRCSVTEVDVSLPVTPRQSLDVNTKFLSSRQPTPRKLASVPKVTDLTGMETQEDMHVEPPNSTAASSMFAGLRSQRRKIKQEDSETVRETLSGQQRINAQEDNEELETVNNNILPLYNCFLIRMGRVFCVVHMASYLLVNLRNCFKYIYIILVNFCAC